MVLILILSTNKSIKKSSRSFRTKEERENLRIGFYVQYSNTVLVLSKTFLNIINHDEVEKYKTNRSYQIIEKRVHQEIGWLVGWLD